MGSGGGGSSSPQQVTQTTSNLPEYAKPYFEDLMNRTAGVVAQPYQPYVDQAGNPLQRLAGFGQDSQAAQEMTRSLVGVGAGDLDSARNAMAGATQYGLSLNQFQPGTFDAGYTPTNYSSGYTPTSYSAGTFSSGYSPTSFSAQTVSSNFTPGSFTSSYTGPQDYNSRTFDAERVQAERTSTDKFGTAQASEYMSPYMEQVLDRQKEAAVQDWRRGQAGRDTEAIRVGAYGGSRQAIQQRLAEEGLEQQLGTIDATGRQAAYEAAMAQFNADQARSLQSQTSNQGANLTAQTANQAAALQAQGLTESSRQFGANLGEQGRIQAAQLGLQAQGMGESSRQYGAGLNMQGQLANQAANLQAQQLSDQSRQFGAGMNLQAQGMGEASRQFGATLTDQSNRYASQAGLQAQQLSDASRQFGAGLTLQQQQANEAARQAAAGLGLQGAGLAMQGGQGIAGLGQLSQQMGLTDAAALGQIGTAQDQMNQQAYDIAYQDFLNQRDYDRNNIGLYSSVLRGLPVTATSDVSTYTNPNTASQLAGLGIAGAGAYRLATG